LFLRKAFFIRLEIWVRKSFGNFPQHKLFYSYSNQNIYLIKITMDIFILLVRDPELVKRIGAATALEVRATGIQYAYAPCIAVSNYN